MKQRTNLPGEARFYNTVVDAKDPSVKITYPHTKQCKLRYDFLYCQGVQWVYWSSSDYPKYLGFEAFARTVSAYGARWMVVDTATSYIVWEGGPDDPGDKGVAGRNVTKQPEVIASARAFYEGSEYD